MPRPLILILLSLFLVVAGKDCVWERAKAFPEIPPIILDTQQMMIRPVVEEGEKTVLRVAEGTKLTLACPGSTLSTVKVEAAEAICIGNTRVMINGKRYSLKMLGCTGKIKAIIKRGVGRCGVESAGELEVIGFNISSSIFYDMIRVCFDQKSQTTLYTDHVLHGAHIAAKEVDSSRPGFKTATGYFTVSMSKCYTKKSQLALMKQLLGSEKLAASMIGNTKQRYFTKGHMSPDADFVTVAEQDATYYYINAVPQWQAFNNGNWKALEYATRALAEKLSTDLRIYSGGWGVLQLPDTNKVPVDIFLGLIEEKKVLPAPALNWKVIHEKSTGRAAAIVGVNNPHITSAPAPICSDLCSSLGWINFKVGDLAHGYTYCCTVADLRKAVPYVPDLGNVDLLVTGNPGCGK